MHVEIIYVHAPIFRHLTCLCCHFSHLALSALFSAEIVYPINDPLCQISSLCESYGLAESKTAGTASHSYIMEREKEYCAID